MKAVAETLRSLVRIFMRKSVGRQSHAVITASLTISTPAPGPPFNRRTAHLRLSPHHRIGQ